MVAQIKKSGAAAALIDKYHNWLILVVAVITLVAGYFFLIAKEIEKLNESRIVTLKTLENQNEYLQQESKKMLGFIDSSVEFTPIEEYLLSRALPTHFDFPSVVMNLTETAKSNGFIITSIDSKDFPAKDSGAELNRSDVIIEVIGGDYDSFKRLLQDWENNLMFFDVIALELKNLSENDLNYRARLAVYYL